MNERDLDKNPYSKDEQRVAQFFFDCGTGGGDDPIGALIASHMALAQGRQILRTALGLARDDLKVALHHIEDELKKS